MSTTTLEKWKTDWMVGWDVLVAGKSERIGTVQFSPGETFPRFVPGYGYAPSVDELRGLVAEMDRIAVPEPTP